MFVVGVIISWRTVCRLRLFNKLCYLVPSNPPTSGRRARRLVGTGGRVLSATSCWVESQDSFGGSVRISRQEIQKPRSPANSSRTSQQQAVLQTTAPSSPGLSCLCLRVLRIPLIPAGQDHAPHQTLHRCGQTKIPYLELQQKHVYMS